jgi:hypothetical protein
MNWKTTLLLVILLGAGAGAWVWHDRKPAADAASQTLGMLKEAVDPAKLTRIEVSRGKESRFVLEKHGDEWSLPGRWPVRGPEVELYLKSLAALQSRFVPETIEAGADVAKLGLGDDALVIKVKSDGKDRVLRLGEEQTGDNNRFTRPTWLRLDDVPERVRLGPGVVAALDRTQDHFQQRRLFPIERVAKDAEAKDKSEKIEQLAAQTVEVKSKDSAWQLAKKGDQWEVTAPTRDRADPDRVKALLLGFPDLWAERFVDRAGKSLDDFGLKEPEFTITVTRPSGSKLKLLVGKESDRKEKVVMVPPPPAPPFGPPPKPQVQKVVEVSRFAKLEDNEQIFEIKSDKLGDIALSLEVLRDPRLARFEANDVKRLEMVAGDQTIVLVKDKEQWRFEKPTKDVAETKPVEEMLDKLSGLRANEKEILDNADLKALGLEKPAATITLVVEDEKDKKQREIVFRIGVKEKEKDKSYLRVDGWPRVNPMDDAVLKLARRPLLAYRNRRVLDLAAADLGKIEIQRGDEAFTLEKSDAGWKLASPVSADVEAAKVESLASELGKLEGIDFVADQPKDDDLDKVYGLAKSKLSAKLLHKDAKKPAATLVIGKQREGKAEFYARVDNGPVFAVKKELRDNLDRASLSYRLPQLWKWNTDDIAEIAITKDAAEYTLKRQGKGWRIAGPFDAEAVADLADDIADDLAKLKSEKYEAHQTKDLPRYGLDKPALQVKVVGKDMKSRTLLVGKAVPEGRYAKLGDGDAVVLLADKAVAAFDRAALDLLDRELLSLNPRGIQKLRWQGASPFTLEPKKEQWQVVDSPAPAFLADEDAVNSTLRPWSRLRADKFAAYGPKIDFAAFGLDKPAATIAVTMNGDKDKKPVEHTLELGKETAGGRFARLDKKDAVVVLDTAMAADLAKSHFDFVDPRVLKYDLDTVVGVKRVMKDADVELAKRDDAWRIAKPLDRPADELTVGDLLEKTFRLRAKRIAAYPAKDLKPFGLDMPTAVVTLQLTDAAGAATSHVLKIGNLAGDAAKKDTDERYAIIDGKDTVVVLPAELSRHLVAGPLYFADRNLASFAGADVAAVERGPRKTAFAKGDAGWQMTEPIKGEAESAALDDAVRGLQRLRADEIVADKGADLKKFGLDSPAVSWKLKAGEREVLHLLVGDAETGKEKTPQPRHYAKLTKGDEVFLLSGKLSAKLLEEFRSRKPWANLDAAQVDQLKIVGPDKTLTLKKRGEAWTIVGDPDAAVSAKAVVDTLDALAGLKALRWQADAKADLQLYGLAKPMWTIEAKTPAGLRTLLLGRTEGDSRRFYATVAGSDSVFILSEADGERLTRGEAAFIEKN